MGLPHAGIQLDSLIRNLFDTLHIRNIVYSKYLNAKNSMRKSFMRLRRFILSLTIAGLCSNLSAYCPTDYLNESNEDFKERMQWFVDAKFGMFVHFGLYSSLGGVYNGKTVDGYAEWIQSTADIPSAEYATLINSWNPKDFNADQIVSLAKKAGMKYLVITTKHHEGFCLWDSQYTDFDIASSPVRGRDFIKELSDACKKYGIKFGTYYSIIDWHHASQERNSNGKDSWGWWAQIAMKPDKKNEYVTYMKNQIKELIEKYDTDILWFDADWVDWWTLNDGKELYNYIRSLKPSIIINNRVAKRSEFKKDFGTPEQEHPGKKQDHVWEACYTLNESWGYKSNDHQWKSPEDIVLKLKEINSNGGNLLLNIGPDGKGMIPQESVEILQKVGTILKK